MNFFLKKKGFTNESSSIIILTSFYTSTNYCFWDRGWHAYLHLKIPNHFQSLQLFDGKLSFGRNDNMTLSWLQIPVGWRLAVLAWSNRHYLKPFEFQHFIFRLQKEIAVFWSSKFLNFFTYSGTVPWKDQFILKRSISGFLYSNCRDTVLNVRLISFFVFDHINGVIFSKIISTWKLSFTLIFVMFCDSNTFVAIIEAIRRLTSQYLWSTYLKSLRTKKEKKISGRHNCKEGWCCFALLLSIWGIILNLPDLFIAFIFSLFLFFLWYCTNILLKRKSAATGS